jgi:hypothetical protein
LAAELNKRLVIAVLLVSASVAAGVWAMSAPTVSVANVRQAETIVLGRDTGSPHTYAISIRGSGRIDGEATISLLLGGQRYRVEKLSGTIDFEWGGDWYAETATIRYEPTSVRSGNVVLHYRFRKL